MGAVVPLATPAAVSSAWNAYAAMCRAQAAETALLNDREFASLLQQKHERFVRLFRLSGNGR